MPLDCPKYCTLKKIDLYQNACKQILNTINEVFSLRKKTAIVTEKMIAPNGIAYSKDKDIADKFK